MFFKFKDKACFRAFYLACILAVTSFGISLVAEAEAPSVTGIRVGEHPQSTRFVMDVTEDVGYRIFTLPDPYRVVVDMPELQWKVPLATKGQARGLISKYRFGLFQPGTSRLVLDVNGPVRVTKSFMLPPAGPHKYRFVIDLVPTDRETFLAGKKAPPAPSAVGPFAPTGKPADGRHVVVIDAGHGGVDPGTISANGSYEKTVTLRAAIALKKELEATGRYKVVLTRDRDIFIPLRERVNIGRNASGDLFVSLHADSIKNRNIRGATVYTLSETSSDKEAAALARKENQADVIAGVDLEGESQELRQILIDLMQRETMNYSAEFANLLIPEMSKSVTMRTNSHRFAGFRVLKAPDVPSVLIELGYLSNASDTNFLTSKQGIERISKSVARAIDQFFKSRDARLASP